MSSPTTRSTPADRPRIDELSLVLPAYNEEECIEEVVAEARTELARRCVRFEIVVVDDGSVDRTAERLEACRAAVPELRVVRHEANRGYAAALRSGFAAARFDPVLYTDADGQFDLADLDRAHELLQGGADLVAGIRAPRDDPWPRRVASHVFNRLARVAVGVRARDIDCAFKLFRLPFLRGLELTSGGFLVDTEIFARAARQGARVVQFPVRHRPRRGGSSTVRWSAVVESLRELGRLRRTLAAGPAVASPAARLRAWRPATVVAAILALTAALALVGEGRRALAEPDEGRYVAAAIGMLDTGDWMVPQLQGLAYLDKPPALYWAIATSLHLLGPSELAARLPLAAAHLLTAGAVIWLGGLLWGRSGGALSGVAYALALGPFLAANVLTPDALLAAFVAWTVAFVWKADRDGGAGTWAAAGAAAGLALMTKGAATLVFVGAAALALSVAHRGVGWLRRRGPWLAVAVAVAVAAPWHLWVWSHLPGSFDYMVSNQIVGRLADSTYDRNPEWTRALTLYPPVLLAGLLPWTFLVAGRLRTGLPGVLRRLAGDTSAILIASWIALPLAVFTVARSRLPLYVLPLFTPLALVAGRLLLTGWRRWSPRRRLALGALAGAWVVALVGVKLTLDVEGWHPDRDGRELTRRIAAVRPTAATRVLAVDATLHSAGFYGMPSAEWTTAKREPYPMFEEPPQLAARLHEITDDEVLLVARREREGDLVDIAARDGFACHREAAVDRLVVLDCESPRRRAGARPASPRRLAPAAPGAGSAVTGVPRLAAIAP